MGDDTNLAGKGKFFLGNALVRDRGRPTSARTLKRGRPRPLKFSLAGRTGGDGLQISVGYPAGERQ